MALQNSADGLVKPGYVIERELSSCVAIAVSDRFEQWRVVADVLGQVRQLVDHQAPDPCGQVVVANQNVFQMSVAAGAVDEVVDAHVLTNEVVSIPIREIQLVDPLCFRA